MAERLKPWVLRFKVGRRYLRLELTGPVGVRLRSQALTYDTEDLARAEAARHPQLDLVVEPAGLSHSAAARYHLRRAGG